MDRDKLAKIIDSLGEYAEARVENTTVKELAMKNGVLVSAASYQHSGVGVRFLCKGSLGFYSSTDTTRLNIDKAKVMASRSVNKAEKYTLAKEEPHKASYEVKQAQPVQHVPIEDCVELLKDVDSQLAPLVSSRFLSMALEYIEKTFINTEGTEITCKIPRISFHYLFTAKTTQRFWQKGACAGFEVFKQWDVANSVEQEAREIIAANNTSNRLTGKVDVVASPEIAGIIAHESCGHPYELDRILGREAAQAGESFVKLSMVGTKFSNECVSVIDDPTVPYSYGYFEFDDEGTKAKPKKLIDRGKINALLADRMNAAIVGQRSSGNSRASAFDREPLIRMSNTFFEPGEKREDELISSVKNGVYLKRFMEWNIDDIRFNQKYVGCEAYGIENGKITVPVKNPVIEITTPQLYSSITDVANNLEFHAASCGKGEPMQGMPVYMGGPSLLIKGVNLK